MPSREKTRNTPSAARSDSLERKKVSSTGKSAKQAANNTSNNSPDTNA